MTECGVFIMSGGAGSRLWPLSVPRLPKQFHRLGTETPLLSETARRFEGLGGARTRIHVIAAAAHEGLVRETLAEAKVPLGRLLLEPCGRDTAAAAAIATLAALEDGTPLVLLTPADHVVRQPDRLHAMIAAGSRAAETHIVTFGITPHEPATGFGYIKCGPELSQGVFAAENFTEKPGLQTAKRYLAEGSYVWNSGMFLFAPSVMAEAFARHAPDIWRAAEQAFRLGRRSGETLALDAGAFAVCPAAPVDKAIMEKSDRVAVVPGSFGWADAGTWDEIWRLLPRDALGNAMSGETASLDTQGTLVFAEGLRVATIGLENLIVVATPDGVLIAPLDRAQDVKQVLARFSGTPA
jgi:mannose-1-phosphate guanylyltransferase / mannose-6-phosphate isomerase